VKRFAIIILSLSIIHSAIGQLKISIISNKFLQDHSCTKMSIEDAKKIFSQTNGCIYSESDTTADIVIKLPSRLIQTLVADDSYQWDRNNNTWNLTAASIKGVSNGIYGIMQEVLGYKFYHPREMIIPNYTTYKIPTLNHFSGKPSFKNMGFHLHTMHPIELTEDLLDDKREGAIDRIYEYIDWLARNGQNYFEFNVLESIELETWIHHAKKISDYSHQRGIRCGLDLSLHMLQQKAFQLYEAPPYKFENIQKQIQYNVDMLSQTGFDVWNVELSATEFTTGDQTKKKKILQFLTGLLQKNNIQLMSRNHVVKTDQMVNGGNGEEAGDILADGQGLMVHTVMFYSLTDEKAPVYRNKNLKHMHEILIKEKTKRPTWYFPESAYWVTFDSSVPMFLLPYFSARLSDIELCEQENIEGHLTFSSGWEWGYGYIDWSIARWCWKYTIDGEDVKRTSLQFINELVSDDFKKYVAEEEKLQQEYIKEKELIRVLVAQTITDEIPGPFNLEFHPRPVYSYAYIRNKANIEQLDSIQILYLDPLEQYFTQGLKNDSMIHHLKLKQQEQEMFDGVQITHLRAKHKWNTLNYIIQKRRNHFTKEKQDVSEFLVEAEKIRLTALDIVKNREANYRYDQKMLTTKHPDHTCYHFGYLYPVHHLHFWEREELQAKNGNYNFWYRNIWDVGRTVGLYD
jgi:hypothetical protein